MLIAVISLVFTGSLFWLKVDFSFDSFFPQDENLTYFKKYKATFGSDDNLILVALGNGEKTVFESDFLIKLDDLCIRLQGYAHVDSVINPIRISIPKVGAFGMSQKPLLNPQNPETFESARRKIKADSVLLGSFFSKDEKFICIAVLLNPAITDSPERDKVCTEIESLFKNSKIDYVMTGVPWIRSQYANRIASELLMFVALAIVLVSFILFLMYRSWWGILIPLACVGLSLIWVMGMMGLAGRPISLTFELLPPILFVVGMSDVVHLITKYSQELIKGKAKMDAMRDSLNEVGLAIFLTSVSTAIGFASLWLSEIQPLREFGTYAAIGVLFAWIISIVIVPSALLLLPIETLTKNHGIRNSPFWDKYLSWTYHFSLNHGGKILLVCIGILGLSLWGANKISFNAYLLDDLKKEDPIFKDIHFFENHFFGIRPFEIAIEAKPGHKVTDMEVLMGIDTMERFLITQTRFSPFVSPVTFLKVANRLSHYGSERHYRMPDSSSQKDELLFLMETEGNSKLLQNVISADKKMARISSRVEDIGTEKFAEVREGLNSVYLKDCDTSAFKWQMTGSAYLAEMNIHYIRDGMFPDLLLSIFLIAILMGILFRSFRMMILSLIPNLLPLVLTAGTMGILGISLRPSSAMIFAITFGIVVDDTMHFLSRLKVELAQGKPLEESIYETLLGTGKALMVTTLILVGGFVLMLFSDFGGTYIFGLFCVVTLFSGMLADLFLFPVLIRKFFNPKSKLDSGLLNEATNKENL